MNSMNSLQTKSLIHCSKIASISLLLKLNTGGFLRYKRKLEIVENFTLKMLPFTMKRGPGGGGWREIIHF